MIGLVLTTLAAMDLEVNILSSYHPQEIRVSSGDKEYKVKTREFSLYVNGSKVSEFETSRKGFEVKWNDKVRYYDGYLTVTASAGELILVNRVSENDYLASVVGAEMVPGAGSEALKAQAVLCRTFIYTAWRHEDQPWDMCDLTHCQSYLGRETRTEGTADAVKETEGEFLTWHGEPCQVYYHSTSGGKTADVSSIWEDVYGPYLKSVDDPYCTDSPHYRWEYVLGTKDLSDALGVTGVWDLRVIDTAADGRVTEIAVAAGQEGLLFDGWKFRMKVCQNLGWNTLKSSWFKVTRDGGAYVFKGRGLGHGVGLSQWGAKGMADEGKDYQMILAHFYPGTEITRWNW